MTKEETRGLSEWMVELARKTPWEELNWSSDQSPDLQEPLKELRNIKGRLELGEMRMGWGDQSPKKVEAPERKKLPSLLDPTAPGFSGFGTELDMLLKKRRVDSEWEEREDTGISELKMIPGRLDKVQEQKKEIGILSDLIDAKQEQLEEGHLLDPTAPGYSGFGTEEDMELARRLKKHQMGLLKPRSQQLSRYNPDRVKAERSNWSPAHGLFQEI